MNERPCCKKASLSRRGFLGQGGGALAGTALIGALSARTHAAENNEIKVALVGCGGRGTGAAANALSTAEQGPVKLWAMADVFDYRLNASLANLNKQFQSQIDVPRDRQFLGFDAYRHAIDALEPGDLVLLATPPAFRPLHLEYAVQKGIHVFMEKSFAVDAPGVHRVLAAGEQAKQKNLKIAGGLMCRHNIPLVAAIERIHDGAIGEVITAWAYRMHGPVGFSPRREGMSELAHQVANYSNFTWLNGAFIVDWLIHNIDVCCWVKDAWPVSAQGQGGRQVRTEPDQLWDHWAVEYTFPDGTRLHAQGRAINNCYGFFGDVIHGQSGCAVLGEGIRDPKIYQGHQTTGDKLLWRHRNGEKSPYQVEHDLLFDAIRNDKPYNETERCARAVMTAIMGRMAGESGKQVTWDEAMNSERRLADVDTMTWESTPPVLPNNDNEYPIAKPGFSDAL